MKKQPNAGEAGYLIAGFMPISFEYLYDAKDAPETYIDLKISSRAEYRWKCRILIDKLNITLETKGETRKEAEEKMNIEHGIYLDSIKHSASLRQTGQR